MAPARQKIGYCGTFWMKRPTPGSIEHLYFVITIPEHCNGEAVVVNATSSKEDDALCVLTRKDHPSIKHDSYVYHKNFLLANMAQLQKALNKSKNYRRDRKAALKTIRKIQDAALRHARKLEKKHLDLINQAIAAS